jgi:hypothetical protein
MYFDFSIGRTFCSNAAQCGQVIEAYSTTVTGALALPSAMSGSDSGFANIEAAASCASAAPIGCRGASPVQAASPVSDRAVARARRVMIKRAAPKAASMRARIGRRSLA